MSRDEVSIEADAPVLSDFAVKTITETKRAMALAAGSVAKLAALKSGAETLAIHLRHGFDRRSDIIDALYEAALAHQELVKLGETVILGAIALGLETFSADPPEEPPPLSEPDDCGLASSLAQKISIAASPYVWRPASALPRREFLYARHYIRNFFTGTVAPGGAGKSTLVTVEALAMASHRPLLGASIAKKPLRVWLWNLEDSKVELERKVQAACLHYGLAPEDIADRLFLDSGRDQSCVIARSGPSGTIIIQPIVAAIVEEVRRLGIDVVIIDPFVSSHQVAENDNNAIDLAIKQGWAIVAERGDCAVVGVHHVRKSGDNEITADSARGASAFVNACRDVRVLNRMRDDEAERAGVENPRLYFRLYSDKSNFAPPSDKSDWYRLVSVDLENGPPGQSDLVQTIERWQWPNAFDGLSAKDLFAVQKKIAGGDWRDDARAENWAGLAVAEALNLDPSSAPVQTRLKSLLKVWLGSGALKIVRRQDKHRKDRNFVEVYQWVTL